MSSAVVLGFLYRGMRRTREQAASVLAKITNSVFCFIFAGQHVRVPNMKGKRKMIEFSRNAVKPWLLRKFTAASALKGSEWSAPEPGRFIPRETAAGTH
jgi:hypothetical protein